MIVLLEDRALAPSDQFGGEDGEDGEDARRGGLAERAGRHHRRVRQSDGRQ
jgi:hypothetical protein